MSRSAIFDRIRIIPRPDDFLDRNVGSSGEIFFDKQANTLRLYNGKATGGFSILTAGNFTQQIADTGVAVLEKTVTVSVDSVAGHSTGVFYINGVEKGNATNTTDIASKEMYIGIDGNASSSPFQGYIEDFRISKGSIRYPVDPIPTTLSSNSDTFFLILHDSNVNTIAGDNNWTVGNGGIQD